MSRKKSVVSREHVFSSTSNGKHHRLVSEDVPEWGGQVWIRCMTAAETETYLTIRGKSEEAISGVRALLLTHTVCTEDGSLMFGPEDVGRLNDQPNRIIERLAIKALSVNGMDEGVVERLVKNYEAIPGADSGSS